MLSILIPTFNYDIVPLVKEIHNQCVENSIEFEILAYDDDSKSKYNPKNSTINSIQNCLFRELPNNIGRSTIRNLLAKNALFDLLLFIDAGTFPKNKDFIKNYISARHENVVNGGMTHTEKPPKKPFKLRWVYTKHREGNALCSSNFLIKKTVFEKHPFDESIKQYGYEDVLFFDNLKENNIYIHKINNPVIHGADDDATTFIKKTELAISNLIELINTNKLNKENFKTSLLYNKLEKLKLVHLTIQLFKLSKPLLIKNFNSSHPSLLLFDFYRLGCFCILKKTKN
jgi:hypothetical protein